MTVFLFIKNHFTWIGFTTTFKVRVCSDNRTFLGASHQKNQPSIFLQKNHNRPESFNFSSPSFLLLNVETIFHPIFHFLAPELQKCFIFAFFFLLKHQNSFRRCFRWKRIFFFFFFYPPPWRMAANKRAIKTVSRVNVSPFWPEFLLLQTAPGLLIPAWFSYG